MVELSLVLIPLLTLICGIMDVAFAIFLKTTFQHAAREGVRYAITGRVSAGQGQDASIRQVVQRNAMGFLSGEEGASKIHIRYYVPGSLVETPSNAGGNIVEVSVEGYRWGWLTPLVAKALPTLNLAARASDRVEPSPGGIPPNR